MIVLMHGKRLARGDAGADAVGAGARLVPVGAEIEPGGAEVIGGRLVADVVDGDALAVGQEQHITQPRHLPVQRLDAEARGAQQLLHRVSMLTQFAVFQNDGRAQNGRVEPVIAHAAPP